MASAARRFSASRFALTTLQDASGWRAAVARASRTSWSLRVGPSRARRLSTRECARLMGLPDSYRLPSNYVEAYDLMGDGVVVSAVRHLAEHILEFCFAGARRQGAR